MKRFGLLGWTFLVLLAISCAQTAPALVSQTAPPTPQPTQIPGRPDLYQLHGVPEHLAYIQWSWIRWQNSDGKRFDELEELVFEFTIHNDVEPQGVATATI